MTTDFRALCAELVRISDALDSGTPLTSNQGQALDGYSALAAFRDVADRSRAALAEPQPEPTANEEVMELMAWLRSTRAARLTRAADLLERQHPKPEPPTDEELWEVYDQMDGIAEDWAWTCDYARAVLARWGK